VFIDPENPINFVFVPSYLNVSTVQQGVWIKISMSDELLCWLGRSRSELFGDESAGAESLTKYIKLGRLPDQNIP